MPELFFFFGGYTWHFQGQLLTLLLQIASGSAWSTIGVLWNQTPVSHVQGKQCTREQSLVCPTLSLQLMELLMCMYILASPRNLSSYLLPSHKPVQHTKHVLNMIVQIITQIKRGIIINSSESLYKCY